MPRLKFDPALLPPTPDLSFETRLWARGVRRVAGIDEAGRGALAGPVCAAVVILPPDPEIRSRLDGVNDSKKMTAAEREDWRGRIPEIALACGVGFASAEEIDAHGIVPATRLAIRRALLEIEPFPDHLLVDHLQLPQVPIPQTPLVKGDARSLSIAAASVLAKTARDDRMRILDSAYPAYAWGQNKGYGTAEHLSAIAALGPCPLHRRTFAPLRTENG